MSLPFLRVRAALILFHSSPLASLDPRSSIHQIWRLWATRRTFLVQKVAKVSKRLRWKQIDFCLLSIRIWQAQNSISVAILDARCSTSLELSAWGEWERKNPFEWQYNLISFTGQKSRGKLNWIKRRKISDFSPHDSEENHSNWKSYQWISLHQWTLNLKSHWQKELILHSNNLLWLEPRKDTQICIMWDRITNHDHFGFR